jgi:hypothetical protein
MTPAQSINQGSPTMTTQAIDFDSLRRPDPPPPGRYRYVVTWLDAGTMGRAEVRAPTTRTEWPDAMREGIQTATRIAEMIPDSRSVSVHAVAC